jgi:DNA-binding response OmpR family regulator
MMATSWRSFVNELREQTTALSRQWERWARAKRTLMAVTRDARCKSSLRTLSLEQGWRILFAETLEDGMRLQTLDRICVLIYDRHLPSTEWRHGLRTLLASDEPMLPIVIADDPSASLRSEVLSCGGYDLARNPVEPECLVPLVNGAFALTESIDSIESPPSQ